MRSSFLLALAGAVVSVAATQPSSAVGVSDKITALEPLPALSSKDADASASSVSQAKSLSQAAPSAPVNTITCNSTAITTVATTTTQSPTKQPNATSALPPGVTGGAIPQQMQSSIVGLLGFCIMGLIML